MAPTCPSIMPLGAITSAPAVGLGHGQLGIERQRGVVVHLAGGFVHDAAVAVVGELVEAAVGHHHHRVADRVPHRGQGPLGDPVGPEGGRAGGVLLLGSGKPEHDDAGHAQPAQPFDLDGQRVHGVLDHAREATATGARLVDAVGHEQRGNQVVDGEAGLGDQAPHGRPARRRRRRVAGNPARARRVRAGGGSLDTGPSLRQVDLPRGLPVPLSLLLLLLLLPPVPAAGTGGRRRGPPPPLRPTRRWCAGWPRRPPPSPAARADARGDRADGDHHRRDAGRAQELDGPLDRRRRGEGDGVGPTGRRHGPAPGRRPPCGRPRLRPPPNPWPPAPGPARRAPSGPGEQDGARPRRLARRPAGNAGGQARPTPTPSGTSSGGNPPSARAPGRAGPDRGPPHRGGHGAVPERGEEAGRRRWTR